MAQDSSTGEKTEKATPKRRREAREKGQVRKSQEVITAGMLLAIFGGLKIFGPLVIGRITDMLIYFLGGNFMETKLDAAGFTSVMANASLAFGLAMLPILGVAMLAALVVNYMQVGFLVSTQALQPKFSRLNPMEGIKRMFSIQTIYELFKSIGKLIIIGVIGVWQVMNHLKSYLSTTEMGAMVAARHMFDTILSTCFTIGIALAVFSVVDYVYQWFKYEKDLRMSKYDIKMEYKQMEGDPEIKAKIKQKQRQMASQRMMHEVPGADVVITNPTHVAVALKYDEDQGGAPTILAKGLDRVAQRIKEIAKEAKIEIVENPEVARAIFAQCELGEEIPGDLYSAVAEILAYVYKMKHGEA